MSRSNGRLTGRRTEPQKENQNEDDKTLFDRLGCLNDTYLFPTNFRPTGRFLYQSRLYKDDRQPDDQLYLELINGKVHKKLHKQEYGGFRRFPIKILQSV